MYLRNPLRYKENDGAMTGRSSLEAASACSSLPPNRTDRGREGRGQDRLGGGGSRHEASLTIAQAADSSPDPALSLGCSPAPGLRRGRLLKID